ncbi:PEPxxWA-CTERM sorting domain-containing protein [Sphingomonas humi]|uniref:Ice-binding protein C-terminal domain-containing protein n=1 Tax=Sphingomonas humi TaxID=335630 RepID=A0ABP7SED7_9SPHN
MTKLMQMIVALGGAALAVTATVPLRAQISQTGYNTLTGTQQVTFGGVAGGPVPGTNYDGLLVIDGVAFGERFAGQTVTANGVYDQIGGAPTGPLTLLPGAPGQNVSVFASPAGPVLSGLGPLGFPASDAIGEGAFSILFPTLQSEFGLRLTGGNGGNAFISFYGSDGTLLGSSTLSNLPLLSSYGFTSANADIAGVSFWNADVTGVGLAGIRFNVATGVPEPGTWMTMLLGFAVIGVAIRRRRSGARMPVVAA